MRSSRQKRQVISYPLPTTVNTAVASQGASRLAAAKDRSGSASTGTVCPTAAPAAPTNRVPFAGSGRAVSVIAETEDRFSARQMSSLVTVISLPHSPESTISSRADSTRSPYETGLARGSVVAVALTSPAACPDVAEASMPVLSPLCGAFVSAAETAKTVAQHRRSVKKSADTVLRRTYLIFRFGNMVCTSVSMVSYRLYAGMAPDMCPGRNPLPPVGKFPALCKHPLNKALRSAPYSRRRALPESLPVRRSIPCN